MTLSVGDSETQLKNALLARASLVAQYVAKYKSAEATLIAGATGEMFNFTIASIKGLRNGLSQLLDAGQWRTDLLPALRELSEAIGLPAGLSNDQMFDLLEEYYDTNSRTIKSRGITNGSVSSVTGSGTGSVIRLTTDRFGNNIENRRVDAKTIECVADQMTLGATARYKELFRIEGAPAPIDNLDATTMTYSGVFGLREFNSTSPESNTLTNGNFTTNSATGGVTTMFTGWTLDSVTGVLPSTATAHIASYPLTPASAAITVATRSFTQRITRPLDRKVPYLPFLAFNASAGSAPSGTTIKISWGSKNQTYTIASETGWNLFIVDRDADLWVDNFYQDQLEFKVEVPVLASGTLYLSFIHFEPMTQVDGVWYCIIPGATTWVKGDYFTVTDTFTGSDSILQKYLVYAFNRYLPHAGSPTVADPTLP